jgi:hypothetical protein
MYMDMDIYMFMYIFMDMDMDMHDYQIDELGRNYVNVPNYMYANSVNTIFRNFLELTVAFSNK